MPGPLFDPEKLARIVRSLEVRGVAFVLGEEGGRICRALGARAIYWARAGGPGTIILPPEPDRSQVIEELMHLGQFRNRGWPSSAENPRLRFEIEIEAQDRLIRLGRRKGWFEPEIDAFLKARDVWERGLRALESGA